LAFHSSTEYLPLFIILRAIGYKTLTGVNKNSLMKAKVGKYDPDCQNEAILQNESWF